MSDITEEELSVSPTICDVAHSIDSYFLLHFWQEDEQRFASYSISMLLEWEEEQEVSLFVNCASRLR